MPYFIVKRKTTIVRTYRVNAASAKSALGATATAAIAALDVQLIDSDESATADWAVADPVKED